MHERTNGKHQTNMNLLSQISIRVFEEHIHMSGIHMPAVDYGKAVKETRVQLDRSTLSLQTHQKFLLHIITIAYMRLLECVCVFHWMCPVSDCR